MIKESRKEEKKERVNKEQGRNKYKNRKGTMERNEKK
jgi:hypothetical protein